MGKLARRTEGGARLELFRPSTLQQLREEKEVGQDEVVYEVTGTDLVEQKPTDLLKPGKTYGVVPYDDKG